MRRLALNANSPKLGWEGRERSPPEVRSRALDTGSPAQTPHCREHRPISLEELVNATAVQLAAQCKGTYAYPAPGRWWTTRVFERLERQAWDASREVKTRYKLGPPIVELRRERSDERGLDAVVDVRSALKLLRAGDPVRAYDDIAGMVSVYVPCSTDLIAKVRLHEVALVAPVCV